jgi:ABC-type glycerol-3-phosphate transport system substrate-binding protein
MEETTMKTKKVMFVFTLILCILFSFGVMYAGKEKEAASEKAAPEEEIVLKIADWQAGVQNILDSYNDFIKIFEAKHPGVKIEYTQYSYTTYNEYLKPALASGEAPDIFAIYPGPDVVEVAKTGNIIALSDIMDNEWQGWLGKAYYFNGARWNDKLWVAPQDAQTELVWIHKDMLEDLGFRAPRLGEGFTVDEWVKIAKAAKAKGYDAILAGHQDSYSITGAFYNMVHQLQPSDDPDMMLQALDGEITWQQDIFREVFIAYKRLHDAGVWRADAINMDYQVQAWGKWLNREGIGIWCNGDWFAGSVPEEENNPNNANIAIVPYPWVNKSATPSFNWGFGTNLAVYSKGEHKDLALEFVRFTNSPEAAEIFVKYYVNPAAAGAVDITKIGETDNPIFNDCIEMYTYTGARASSYFYPHAEPQRALFDGVINVMLGREEIDDVLAELDEVCGYK